MLKSIGIILLHVAVGIALLVLGQNIAFFPKSYGIYITAILFIGVLILDINWLRQSVAFKRFWSVKKLPLLLAGIAAGTIIGNASECIALLTNQVEFEHIATNFTARGVFATFVIVGWEELWFRGIYLNYCQKHLSTLSISLLIGFLFMAVHGLNPELNLLESRPALFFAGTMLTLAYFVSKSFWLPLGLHFGNNLLGSVITTTQPDNSFFAEDGYVSAMVLLLACLLLLWVDRRELSTPSPLPK